MRLVQSLAALIAPPVCSLCGGTGQWLDEPWGLDLCEHCQAACRRAPPAPAPLDEVFCLFRYEDPVDHMIQQLKFNGALVHARVLGTLLAQALRARGRDLPACVVPMPLHAQRLRERGFCQTTEIGRHLVRRLRDRRRGHPVLRPDLLQRVRATRAQSGLDAAARSRNLEGAFAAAAGPLPAHLALLDDVLTTGHTARAAVAALRAGGAVRVEVWCCARALRHGEA